MVNLENREIVQTGAQKPPAATAIGSCAAAGFANRGMRENGPMPLKGAKYEWTAKDREDAAKFTEEMRGLAARGFSQRASECAQRAREAFEDGEGEKFAVEISGLIGIVKECEAQVCNIVRGNGAQTEEAGRAKELFVVTISHNLNTRITAATLKAENLRDKIVKADAKRELDCICRKMDEIERAAQRIGIIDLDLANVVTYIYTTQMFDVERPQWTARDREVAAWFVEEIRSPAVKWIVGKMKKRLDGMENAVAEGKNMEIVSYAGMVRGWAMIYHRWMARLAGAEKFGWESEGEKKASEMRGFYATTIGHHFNQEIIRISGYMELASEIILKPQAAAYIGIDSETMLHRTVETDIRNAKNAVEKLEALWTGLAEIDIDKSPVAPYLSNGKMEMFDMKQVSPWQR